MRANASERTSGCPRKERVDGTPIISALHFYALVTATG